MLSPTFTVCNYLEDCRSDQCKVIPVVVLICSSIIDNDVGQNYLCVFSFSFLEWHGGREGKDSFHSCSPLEVGLLKVCPVLKWFWVTYHRTFLDLISEACSAVYMYHLSMHPFVGALFCFNILAIVNSAARKIGGACIFFVGFPSGAGGACQCRRRKRCGCSSWVWKIPWRRAWQSTPVPCLENPMDRGACGLQSMGSQWVGHDCRD